VVFFVHHKKGGGPGGGGGGAGRLSVFDGIDANDGKEHDVQGKPQTHAGKDHHCFTS